MFNRFLSRFAPIGRSQSQPFAVSGNECWDLSSARVICRRLIVLPGGRRPSRAALVAGAEYWRLHAALASATFVLFPLFGLDLWAAAPHALPRSLWSGVLFVCVLPSTTQFPNGTCFLNWPQAEPVTVPAL
jgi:predicted Na+-dependent transporter